MSGSERRSTLYLRGSAALTLSEMQAFVQELEIRPRARLLADLPQLLVLTESRFELVERVLLRRIPELRPQESRQFLAALREEAAHTAEPAVRERAERLLQALTRVPDRG